MIKAGDKVGASEATLLNMLKISPFTYGLEIEQGTLVCVLHELKFTYSGTANANDV